MVFRGHVDDRNELAALFQGAKLVVLPSVTRAEAFGMVLVEALGWRKPLVSTALDTGVSEVNDHGVTGLVVPAGDPAALANAIHTILNDASLAETFSDNAHKKFMEKYSADSMVAKYIEQYQGAMHG